MTSVTPLQVTPEIQGGPIAIIAVALYFVLVIGIGVFFYKKSSSSTEDFWIAGGEISTKVQLFAFVAVYTSAGSFLGYPGYAYGFGAPVALAILIGATVGIVLFAILLAGPIRRSGVYTLPAFLEMRYQSRTVRLVGAIIFGISAWAYVIPQLVAAAISFDFLFSGLGYAEGVIVTALVFAVYVSLGGFWAVTWADFIQGILIVVLALMPIPFILLDFGGVGTTISAGAEANSAFLGSALPISSLIGAGLVFIFSILALPQSGQRILSSKDDKTARRSLVGSAPVYVGAFTLSSVFVGGAALSFEPNLANPDFAYYVVMSEYFGPLLTGLGVAAILAAIMSHTDSLLIALSASISHDIPSTLQMDMSDRQEVILGQAAIWLGVITSALVALDPPGLLLELVTVVGGGIACGLFPAVALGTWWKRANGWGAISAMIAGFGLYGYLYFLVDIPTYSEILIALPVGILAFVVVSLLTRRPTDEEMLGFATFHSESIEAPIESSPDD